MRACLTVLLALWGCAVMADRSVTLLDYADLSGWAEDDHAAALGVFRETCGDRREPEWQALCGLASAAGDDPRAFFEHAFRPVLIEDGADMLFTGYYEPEIRGDRFPSPYYDIPVYRMPDTMPEGGWPTRQQIDEGALAGQGLELAWVHDPLDLFFLQIQGSGRIRLPGGQMMRLGYGGHNGFDYRSIGQELVARGEYEPHQVSADVIRSWVRRSGDEGRALLWHNPSYVFFRNVDEVPADRGPLGAMNRSITAGRSIAVDPSIYPLGAPVWIERQASEPMNRLMIAQDTGSAIKGAQRADIFFGTGREAGAIAGNVRDGGRMVVLLPIQEAYALLPDRPALDG